MIDSAAENSSSTYEPTVYTLLLTGMCLLLALFLLTRLLVALRNKNKLLAWSTGFYVLCLLWTGVRAAYWILMSTQASMRYLTLYLLYWSPTPIQFANFSLLILFYIQVLTGPEWRSTWRNVCLPLYLLLTMTMTTFTVVWAFNSSNDISKATRRGDEYDQEFSRVSDVSVQLKYSAFCFFLLSVLFGFFGWKMANVESWKRRRLLISKPRSLAVINSLLCLIFFTRGTRDLATSQSWFLSIWNNLDMNGRVTTVAYFVFFCFWEFLPTILLLCLVSSKAGGVGAPKHGPASQKLPDYGIFHIINTGEGKLLAASPLGASTYSYGTRTEGSAGSIEREPERERPRWTHGGDLFQDPLRYDSDDGPVSSPRHFSDSYTSDASNNNFYERVPGYLPGI
ncbi:hypothetical protein PRIC1_003521 [Phytophthora ramorum]|uniref:uncharacterized protein n=1 Tax=Phytophthora ramorum TaxID=164328 RepID=UPI0030B71CE9|nr:hypothetical protein KRP23_3290 [Phytophthora ramorum]KAH7508393.1 hypothetical protein KRP22_3479 [Phytophthora ramorum]